MKPLCFAAFAVAMAVVPLRAAISPEAGAFVLQTYSPKAYGANPQNWAIAQDKRGVLYFGNNDGVLEFDGVFWRLIPLAYGSAARSLAVDELGRVYVGGQGVFGYLQPDARGVTQFIPIPVPKADIDFLDVWNVVPTSSGVYFGAESKVFFLTNSGRLKIWRATKRFGRIFSAYNELFASTTDLGLRRLSGDEFVPGPKDEALKGSARLMFAYGEHPLLASGKALFHFTLGEIKPFENEAAAYLNDNLIYAAKQLASGDIAIGSKNGGLVFLDPQGKLERKIGKPDGLPSDWITAIFEDRDRAIWLATNNGIARLDMRLSTFGEPQGLQGTVISQARAAGVVYAGTTRGLFRLDPQPGQAPAFAQISNLREQVFALAERNGRLFAGGEHGFYLIAGGKAEKLPGAEGVVWDIEFSRRDPAAILTAGLGGVRKWRPSGSGWKSTEPRGVPGQDFRTVVEDADGTIWSTTNVAIWHFDSLDREPRVQQFTSADRIPAGFKSAYLLRGHAVVATQKGLLRFSEKTQRLEPDPELGAAYASKPVSIVRETPAGNIWITGQGYQDLLEKDASGTWRVFSSPLVQTGATELWSLFFDPDGVGWASDPNGILIRLENSAAQKRPADLPVLLRRVAVIGQPTALFQGDAPLAAPPSLDHRDNALRFEFSAPFYEAPAALQYQFRLEGNEKNWSPWTPETHKDYTNLFEGSYRFHVRALDPHGVQTTEVVFPFRVFPPFYRTWWAYLAYAAVFLFAGWLILRWRLKALKEKNRWLEGVVLERTAEVRKERDQNEALLLNILPRPVAAELRSSGAVKPTTFEDATVCFSDFVGFTLSSEKLPAETLINALNEYFTAFDGIIGRYGLEKLKTIGDAYMFAGGLPNLRPSHAVDAVLAALEMAAVVDRLTHPEKGVNWKIRLGLYSGPVVSGVVGVRKFAFDIWGNTVNFAARMESAGKPGRVNLSETTFHKVERFIECEARGPVPIKEGREMQMYFALSPKLELLAGPTVDGVPEAFRAAYESAFGEAPRSFPDSSTLNQLMGPALTGPGGPQ